MVLKLFEHFRDRNEFSNICFIADRDTWIFGSIPERFVAKNLIFTFGYSVENDIFIDGKLENLLTPEEMRVFDGEIEKFVRWFSAAAFRYISGVTWS